MKGSIIFATGKIIDVYYIIFRPIIFTEPLLKTTTPFGVLPPLTRCSFGIPFSNGLFIITSCCLYPGQAELAVDPH